MIFALQSVQDNASNEETTGLEFLKSSTYAQLLVLCNYVYCGIALNREWQESQQIRLQAVK
jgi:hypothetical protein